MHLGPRTSGLSRRTGRPSPGSCKYSMFFFAMLQLLPLLHFCAWFFLVGVYVRSVK
uniref:Uncharacterized protein n=1 Tax=Oryza sativa subsp. japonica TaxID=39947 RepID=Q6YT72_ORYSJ|nr:unknown protein [Oryza sativa Japonica Group]BAD31579.1 unknown protein [Oryza sativa Japonica Group]